MTTPVMDMRNIVCIDCGHPIPVGSPYSQRLTDLGPDPSTDCFATVEVVCPVGFCRGPNAKGDSSEVRTDV